MLSPYQIVMLLSDTCVTIIMSYIGQETNISNTGYPASAKIFIRFSRMFLVTHVLWKLHHSLIRFTGQGENQTRYLHRDMTQFQSLSGQNY
jgi:hypothetical protein